MISRWNKPLRNSNAASEAPCVPQTDRQVALSETADTHETEENWKQVGGPADRPE